MESKKELAFQLAVRWWKLSGRTSGVCDRCSAPVGIEKSYLCKPLLLAVKFDQFLSDFSDLPDMICEECFDASPDVEPFEGDSDLLALYQKHVLDRNANLSFILNYFQERGCAYCGKIPNFDEALSPKYKVAAKEEFKFNLDGTQSRLYTSISDLTLYFCADCLRPRKIEHTVSSCSWSGAIIKLILGFVGLAMVGIQLLSGDVKLKSLGDGISYLLCTAIPVALIYYGGTETERRLAKKKTIEQLETMPGSMLVKECNVEELCGNDIPILIDRSGAGKYYWTVDEFSKKTEPHRTRTPNTLK